MYLPERAHCGVDIVGLADRRVVYLDRMLSALDIHNLGTIRRHNADFYGQSEGSGSLIEESAELLGV